MNRKEELKARSVWFNEEYHIFISFEDFLKYVWEVIEEQEKEEEKKDGK